MAETNVLARTMHDLGAAVWTGGSLMGAVGLNGASAQVSDASERTKVASAGWQKWTPVNLAAIAAHLAGGIGLVLGNKGRLMTQRGAMAANLAKTGLTIGALAATAYSRALGQKIIDAGPVPARSGVEPNGQTPQETARAQKQLGFLQWAIPAMTAGVVVLSAVMGEQQRPTSVARGLVARLMPNR
jgi:uncharacterized membrane protein